jgi:hypothetical protein
MQTGHAAASTGFTSDITRMKSPQSQPSNPKAPIAAPQASKESLGYESPTYGALAAEIVQSGLPPVQGYGMQVDALRDQRGFPSGNPAQLLVAEAETTFKRSPAYTGNKVKWDALLVKAQAATAEIDAIVQTAYQLARGFQALNPGDNKFLKQWKASATKYFQSPGEAPPKLISAHFGYAVESLASAQISGRRFQGLHVLLQVTHGSSRPDIVLIDDSDGAAVEVAWLDITAAKSTGHIQDKASSGWTSRPYIAELVYPSLDLQTDIIAGVNDPLINSLAGYYTERAAIENSSYEEETDKLGLQIEEFSTRLTDYGLAGDQATKKGETRDFLRDNLGMNLGGSSLIATKGALSFVGAHARYFGFASDDRMDSSYADQYVAAKAHPLARYETFELNSERIATALDDLPPSPIKTQIAAEAATLHEKIQEDLGTLDVVEPSEMDVPAFDREISQAVMRQGNLLEKLLAFQHSLAQFAQLDQVKAHVSSLGMINPALRERILAAIDVRKNSPQLAWDHDAWKNFYFTNAAIIAAQNDLTTLRQQLGIPE